MQSNVSEGKILGYIIAFYLIDNINTVISVTIIQRFIIINRTIYFT